MSDFFKRIWAKHNFQYCKAEAYMAYMRGELLVSADWESRASDWELEYQMIGRRLV